jgi:dTDP-4-dehydrorhamnose 3,5-epimerase
MKVIKTSIPDVLIFEPQVYSDERGFFFESWSQKAFSDVGVSCNFVQDNHSKSTKGVLRGLHYQLGNAQDKLVRVISGEVFDVAVDLRKGSPTFGKWVGVCLSADNKRQVLIPKGFAHGFLVLSDEAEFLYKCSDYYNPSEERSLIWNDPHIAIDWPLDADYPPLLSKRDTVAPEFSDIPDEDFPVYDLHNL